MRGHWLTAALLVLLLLPSASACSVGAGTHMEGRFLLWDPATGEVVRWPAMEVPFGASCEPNMPRVAFDGERLLWAADGRLRFGDRRGQVTASHPAAGQVAGWTGPQVLLVETRDATRTLRVLDLSTGAVEPRAWPAHGWRPFAGEGGRIAWTEGDGRGTASLAVHDVLAGRAIVANRSIVFADGTPPLGAGVSDLGARWVVGWASAADGLAFPWAYDLAGDRFLDLAPDPEAELGVAPLYPDAFVGVDGDLAYLAARRGGAAWLWRADLPAGAFAPVAALPVVDGMETSPVEVRGGLVVLATGRLVQGLPGLPVAGALGALVLAAAVGLARPRR